MPCVSDVSCTSAHVHLCLADPTGAGVRGDINSMFAGNVGSGINQEVMGRTLGDIATGIYGDMHKRPRSAPKYLPQ